jgi:hypothetical protein
MLEVQLLDPPARAGFGVVDGEPEVTDGTELPRHVTSVPATAALAAPHS